MAYQTSTTIASNQLLINAIALFAASAGWTVERNVLSGANRTVTLRKPGVTDYIHLFNTANSGVRMRASVGYDDALPIASQPNVTPVDSEVNALVGPYPTVWMFASGDNVHVVVRRSDISGGYAHILFGAISKYGAYTGGTYIEGTYFATTGSASGVWDNGSHAPFGFGDKQTGYLRCDSDGVSNQWLLLGRAGLAGRAWGSVGAQNHIAAGSYDITRWVYAADDNVFSGRSFLQIIDVYVPRAGTTLYFTPVGYPDNLRYVSLAKFDPEQEVSIGTDTYVVFPVARKAAPSTAVGGPIGTSNFGYAIRKEA